MKKIIIFTFTTVVTISANFSAKIYPISHKIKTKMLKGNSYRNGCPISTKNLRYIRLIHKNFKSQDVLGELIVDKNVANDVVKIFKELYKINYPIKKMKLVSNYGGNDWKSIEADNTSAFNCRNVGVTSRWSRHSYGKAIDINPIENPYVSKSGYISHKASYRYKRRKKTHRAVILKNDKVFKITIVIR